MGVGQSQAFTATGRKSDGSTEDVTAAVTWSSSSPAVADIDDTGLAESFTQGTGAVHAAYLGRSDSTTLTVGPPVVASVSVFPSSWSLPIGIILVLEATATYSDGSTANVTNTATWTSSNESVVYVGNNIGQKGWTVGIILGSETVTATLDGASGSSAITVIPAAFTSITIAPVNPTVGALRTQAFTATGHKSNGQIQDLTSEVTWSSSNPAVAGIDAAGLAPTITEGTTTIAASYLAFSDSTTMTVVPSVVSVSVAPTSWSLPIGIILVLEATATYSDGSTANVTNTATWTSSNESVVYVGNNIGQKGWTVGIILGSETVTATLDGASGTSAITVIPAAVTSITIAPVNPTVGALRTQAFTATGHKSNGQIRDSRRR